jgi:hypothetical protein
MSCAKLRGQPLRRQGSQINSRRFLALPRRRLDDLPRPGGRRWHALPADRSPRVERRLPAGACDRARADDNAATGALTRHDRGRWAAARNAGLTRSAAAREVDQPRALLPAAPPAAPVHVVAVGTTEDVLPLVQPDPACPASRHSTTLFPGSGPVNAEARTGAPVSVNGGSPARGERQQRMQLGVGHVAADLGATDWVGAARHREAAGVLSACELEAQLELRRRVTRQAGASSTGTSRRRRERRRGWARRDRAARPAPRGVRRAAARPSQTRARAAAPRACGRRG